MKTKNTDLQKPKKRFFTRDARYPDAYTIDLRYINSRAYCDSRELGGIGDRVYNYFLITMVLLGLGFILSFFVESAFAKSHHGVELSVRDQIRYERLEMCQQAYKESGINKKFIHGQIPAVRCATYLTLIYAYESGF